MAHTNLINGINLTPTNSLVHLLDSNDTDDNNEVPIVKHSAFYGENDCSSMLAKKLASLFLVEISKVLKLNLTGWKRL